jgi:hypothetical protein
MIDRVPGVDGVRAHVDCLDRSTPPAPPPPAQPTSYPAPRTRSAPPAPRPPLEYDAQKIMLNNLHEGLELAIYAASQTRDAMDSLIDGLNLARQGVEAARDSHG